MQWSAWLCPLRAASAWSKRGSDSPKRPIPPTWSISRRDIFMAILPASILLRRQRLVQHFQRQVTDDLVRPGMQLEPLHSDRHAKDPVGRARRDEQRVALRPPEGDV